MATMLSEWSEPHMFTMAENIIDPEDPVDPETPEDPEYIEPPMSYVETAIITEPIVTENSYFGYEIAMSGDGTRCAIGPNSLRGVYIFARSGAAWLLEANLIGSDASANGAGAKYKLNYDGSRCIIGHAESEPGFSTGVVYIFARSGTSWVEEVKLTSPDVLDSDTFGISISIDANATRCIIGCTYNVPDDYFISGAAYVFIRSGSSWLLEAKLIASDSTQSGSFGVSVDIDSTGKRCIVGAHNFLPYASVYPGNAFVYVRSGTAWVEEARLVAADSLVEEYFGNYVAISSNGYRCVIGAPSATVDDISRTGAAYIFTRSGETWTEEAKLVASDKTNYAWFGCSVSMSSNGYRCLVGASATNMLDTNLNEMYNVGSAYTFRRTNLGWVQEAELLASNRNNNHNLGRSISMSANGTKCLLGAYGANVDAILNAGAVYEFTAVV